MKLVLGFIIIVNAHICFGQDSLWQSTFYEGNYTVGFKAIYTFDDSRDYQINDSTEFSKGRPLRIFYWYPSEIARPNLKPMTISDYINSAPQDPNYYSYYEMLRENDFQSLKRKVFVEDNTTDPVAEILQLEGVGKEYVDFDGKKYPLILYVMGRNNHQIENLFLWEFLASHGYCVAVVVQQGYSGSNNRLEFNLDNLYYQMEDIEFTYSMVSRFPNVDASKIVMMGHSSGALQSLLFALENTNIKSLISLDGTISSNDGVQIVDSTNFKLDNLKIDLLNLYNLNKRSLNFDIIKELKRSSIISIGFKRAIHQDFQMFPLYCSISQTMFPGISEVRNIDTGAQNYKIMSKIVLNYLDFIISNRINEIQYQGELEMIIKEFGELLRLGD